jgi:hypothetical protein
MSETGRRESVVVAAEQLRYACVLDWGMKLGLSVLVAGFLAYVSGILPAQVPLADLPRLWSLPVADYLRETGMSGGWSWLAMLGTGDALSLAGLALLAGASVPCLLALLPAFVARRDRAYFAIALALAGVLVLAASGLLTWHG